MTNPPLKFVPSLADRAQSYRAHAPSKNSAWAAAELPPTSFDHLSDFLTWQIHQYRDGVTYPLPKTPEEFPALRLAAKELEKMVNSPRGSTLARTWRAKQQDGEPQRFSFLKDLLPFIWDAALEERIPENLEDGLSFFTKSPVAELQLTTGQSGTRSFLARSLVFLLSNALLLNVTAFRSGRFGNIDLYHLLAVDYDEIGKERTLCLLAYLFYVYAGNPSDLDTRVITFERVSYPETSLDDPFAPPAPLPSPSTISISAASMESPHADAFFDFANKRVHIHRIIASCTQEEVLFSACPEAFASLLLYETLSDTEVGLIRGVRRFCSYTGYMDTFQFVDVDPVERNPEPFTILIADACYSEHFFPKMVRRDVAKAYHVFRAAATATERPAKSFATGHWGCGVFGGDKAHKFLQQVVAFSRLVTEMGEQGKDLVMHYSVFGDTNLVGAFVRWVEEMDKKGVTCAQLEAWIVEYGTGETGGKRKKRESFEKFIDVKLSGGGSSESASATPGGIIQGLMNSIGWK